MNELQPTPPENVRVVLTDDTEVPVECVFTGWLSCGCAEWVVVTPVYVGNFDDGVRLKIDYLPPQTELAVLVSGYVP